jgi:hypothetical protein
MNLVLGDVVETIYVVDDEEAADEDIKVSTLAQPVPICRSGFSRLFTDGYQEIRNAVRSRYVLSVPLVKKCLTLVVGDSVVLVSPQNS